LPWLSRAQSASTAAGLESIVRTGSHKRTTCCDKARGGVKWRELQKLDGTAAAEGDDGDKYPALHGAADCEIEGCCDCKRRKGNGCCS